MHNAIPILAAGEDPTVKLVIGVVVAVIWIISQVVGAISKKPDRRLPPSGPPLSKAPRPQDLAGKRPDDRVPNRMPSQLPRGIPPMRNQTSTPVPPPIKRQKPPPVRREPQRPVQQRPVPQRPTPVAAPPVVVTTRSPIDLPPARRAPISDAIAAKPAAAKGLPRKQVLGALLKTRNLKKAYALTEILQQPVSLRPSFDADR